MELFFSCWQVYLWLFSAVPCFRWVWIETSLFCSLRVLQECLPSLLLQMFYIPLTLPDLLLPWLLPSSAFSTEVWDCRAGAFCWWGFSAGANAVTWPACRYEPAPLRAVRAQLPPGVPAAPGSLPGKVLPACWVPLEAQSGEPGSLHSPPRVNASNHYHPWWCP